MNTDAPPQKLFTFASGGWVLLLAFVLCLLAAGVVLWPIYQTGFHRAIGDGKNPDTYGFDLSNLSIPRSSLIASGKAKDEVRTIVPVQVDTQTPAEVAIANKNERIHFIIPPDRVIGVTINGESRAYPVRILNHHELVNDTLGGVPIAITWSSLCDSVLVFDRRIDGPSNPPVEFGVSGLLVNSNSLYFDRRSQGREESLWLQLSMKAVAGPAVGKKLATIPCEMTTWKDWTDAHPDTRVFIGLRTLKRSYGDAQDPFNLYLANDTLLFPVDPLWKGEGVPKKTRVIATSTDGEHWKVALPGTLPARAENEQRIPTFIFAWYAQHQNDTDYSAITSK